MAKAKINAYTETLETLGAVSLLFPPSIVITIPWALVLYARKSMKQSEHSQKIKEQLQNERACCRV